MWTYERDAGQHFRAFTVDGVERLMLVYKSGGGDYAITCMQEGDPCGGDVDFEPTLTKAKAKAEALIESGHWLELAL
jgi:hypothetical protein